MIENLTSGLIGAIAGGVLAALATFFVAWWQLKLVAKNHVESLELVTKNHREALDEQNKLIQETFSQQLLLQAREKKIQYQLEFLSNIEKIIEKRAWDTYLKGFQLGNLGHAGALHNGISEFSAQVREFQGDVSKIAQDFSRMLSENGHLEKFDSVFRSTLNFQDLFFEPVSKLILILDGYPVNPSAEIAELIEERFRGFSTAVNELENWRLSCREKCKNFRRQIFDGVIF